MSAPQPPAADNLVERLGYHHEHPVTGKLVLLNPDGPKAAARIAALEARVKVLEEALREALWIINEGVSVDISDAELRAAHPEDRRFIKRTHRLVEAARAALGERHD